MYETFDHTADLGLRVRSGDLPSLFAEAARGLFAIIVPDLSTVHTRHSQPFDLAGREPDLLLFDWLNELLFAFDTQRLLFSEFTVHLSPGGLTATAQGEPFDPSRHRLEHEVKAITYHGLTVRKLENEWMAEVIVDI